MGWLFKRKKEKEDIKQKEETQVSKTAPQPKATAKATKPAKQTTKGTTKQAAAETNTASAKKSAAPKAESKTVKPTPKKAATTQNSSAKAKPAAKAKKPAEEGTERKSLYRVSYDKDSRTWIIKKDGAKRKIASYVTKEEAMTRVKELCNSQDLNFVVHKKDGKFQKK